MTNQETDSKPTLRQRAEEHFQTSSAAPQAVTSLDEANRLLHELRVHQIEIEMQKEELQRSHQELVLAKARYLDLYDLAPVGYCTVSEQGLILTANHTAAALLGLPRGKLHTQPFAQFLGKADQDMYYRFFRLLFMSGEPQTCEVLMVRRDSSTFWAQLVANLAEDDDATHVCRLVMTDITARKRAEESLRQSEEKYRTVADFTYDFEFWINPEGKFIYCSPSCLRVTGQTAAALQDNPNLLRSLVHPEDLAAYDGHRHEAQGQKIGQGFEYRIQQGKGSNPWTWLSHSCQPVYDGNGNFLGTRGSNRDITERKLLEAEATKNQNLASLGVLAGGIAHDFNNLFQGLLGNISLAEMCLPETSEPSRYLRAAEQVYQEAAKLTGQLIAFSTGSILSMTNLQPVALIREEAVSSLTGTGLVADLDLPAGLWPIRVNQSQFREVIKQLLRNAKDATKSLPGPTGGTIKITATNEILAQGHGRHPSLDPGDYVRISIKDQGCGISRDHLARIFDPYFSTKCRGAQKGMGLGLTLCDTIIKKHGGVIAVQSQPGKGSTFDIYLPAATDVAKKTTLIKDQETGGQRILLMDDDLGVLEVTATVLSRAGYRVDQTVDGEAAISAYQEARTAGEPYALAILDLEIPSGMGGLEVIAILKQIDPEVKAIVSSGYSKDPGISNFADYGFIAACVKPYPLAELKALVKQFV